MTTQIVPYADSAPLSGKAFEEEDSQDLPRLPHGMITTHADAIIADLPAL